MKLRISWAAVVLVICLGVSLGGPAFAQSEAVRAAALQARLSAMDAETAYVESITKIQRLGRAFGYYTDKGYFGEAADLFTEDATFQWGADGIYKGRARIHELLTRQGGGSMKEGPGLPFGRLNLRMQLQPVITIAADGKSAQGRWREWGLLGQYKKQATWGDAVIEDSYVKDNGVWKITARRYYLNFEAPYQGGWAAMQPVEGAWQSPVAKLFAPDAPAAPGYAPFPAVFVPPYHYANGDLTAIKSRAPFVRPKRAGDALGKLEAQADAKELQLARTHSVRAIENLQAMYGYYIDKGQWKKAAGLFSRDGTYEFGQSGVYVGSTSVERGIGLMGPPGLEQGQLNNYVMVQPIIHISDDNRTAKARWRSDVLLARGGKGRWGGGIYENEYVNDKGTWKFSKLHYYVTFWGDYEQGWSAKSFPMDPPSESNPPDRPPTLVYESFPKLQVVPYHYVNPVSGKPHQGE
jgi:SnoaL-like domain